MIRLPRHFFDDHRERLLPTPEVERSTAKHVWVREDAPELPELLSDARYYASEAMYMDPPMPGLASSARATAKALEEVVR